MIGFFSNGNKRYNFLYIYGIFLAKLLSPIFLRYPVLKKWGEEYQKLIIYSFSSHWGFSLFQVFYVLTFCRIIFISNPTLLALCNLLLLQGTFAGGTFFQEHFWEFPFLFFPISVFFLVTVPLWISIVITLVPGVVETPSKALMDYELLERRVEEMGRLLFLSYLFLYIFLCYDLYSVYAVEMNTVAENIKKAQELRCKSLQELADLVGVKIDPREGDDLLLDKIEKNIEKLIPTQNSRI